MTEPIIEYQDAINFYKEMLDRFDFTFNAFYYETMRECTNRGKTYLYKSAQLITNISDTQKIELGSRDIVLMNMVLFSVVDLFIDSQNTNLVGQHFSQKYDHLPEETNKDIILKECYWISQNIRNVIVHDIYNISLDNRRYLIQNKTKDDRVLSSISISRLDLYSLYNMIYFACMHKCQTPAEHSLIEGTLSYRYHKLCKYVRVNDRKKDRLLPLIDTQNLLFDQRRVLLNANYQPTRQGLTIELPRHRVNQQAKGITYQIKYEGQNYLIPSEMLDKDNTIHPDNLQKWKYQ